MTTEAKHGVIANLRDRFLRAKSNGSKRGESAMAEIVRRGDYPVTEWDPFRMMREMLRIDPFRMMGMLGVATPEQDEAGSKASRFLSGGRNSSGEGSMLEFMGEERGRGD